MTLVAAEWGTGQVLWTMLWLFLFVIWIWLIIVIFSDIIRSHDIGGWTKALWSAFIIFLPFLGIITYLIVRGGSMSDRAAQQTREANEATAAYLHDAAAVSHADELEKLAGLHTAGKLDDAEYTAAKAKVIA